MERPIQSSGYRIGEATYKIRSPNGGRHQTVHFDRLKFFSAEKGLDLPVDIVLRGPKSGRKTVENEFAQARPAVRSDVGLQLLAIDGDDEPTTENIPLIPAAAPIQERAPEEPAAAQAQRYPTRQRKPPDRYMVNIKREGVV